MAITLDGTAGITTPDLTDSSLTSGRVVYAGTSGNLTGSTGLIFDGSNLGVGASPSYRLSVSGTNNTVGLGIVGTAASGDNGIYYNLPTGITGSYNIINAVPSASTGVNVNFGNGNSSSTSAHSRLNIETTGAGGGDPKTTYTISGVLNWCTGIDNSDSDKFKISRSDEPGTNDYLTINSTGAVALNGAVTTATGVGITFPATQSASTDANTLDDYEEGTWTVVDRSGAGLTFTTNASKYIKIGKMVYAFADVTFPSTASTASVNLSLPFAPDPQYAQMGAPIRNNKSLTCNPFSVPDSGGGIIFLKSALYTDYQTNANMTSGTCQFSITYSSAN